MIFYDEADVAQQDEQALLESIPNFYQLPKNIALQKLYMKQSEGKCKFQSTSFNPEQNWENERRRAIQHGRPVPPVHGYCYYTAEKEGFIAYDVYPDRFERLKSLGFKITRHPDGREV